jgi:hypothetical protein
MIINLSIILNNVLTGAEPAAHSSKIRLGQSPRRLKRLQTLHNEERLRIQQNNDKRELLDTGAYDEAFLGSWMRRTNWTSTFSGVNRPLLVRLAEAPFVRGSPLLYGIFEGQHQKSSVIDERKIRSIGLAIDASLTGARTPPAIPTTQSDAGYGVISPIDLTRLPSNCPSVQVRDLDIAHYGEDSCISGFDCIAWNRRVDERSYDIS